MSRESNIERYYDTAQICENGHLINCHAKSKSTYNQINCTKCGKPTFMLCVCGEPIRGCRHTTSSGVVSGYSIHRMQRTRTIDHCQDEPYEVPAYCHKCGKPYPWTEATLIELDEIVGLSDELDEVEKTILKEKFPFLLFEQPGTVSAALRIAKILKPVANTTGRALKSALASKIAGIALEHLGWK